MAVKQNKVATKIRENKNFFKDLNESVKDDFNKLKKSGVNREDALKQIRARITKESGAGTLNTIASEFNKNKGLNSKNVNSDVNPDGIQASSDVPGVTGVNTVNNQVDNQINENNQNTSIDTIQPNETAEQKTLREKVAGRIAGRKTEEEKLNEARVQGGRQELVDLQSGFRKEASSVQEDLDNITKGLDAEGGAITKIAASRIREGRSAPLRDQLTSLVKGQVLTSQSLAQLDSSIDGILNAREIDRQNEVSQLTGQIEGSNLSSEEKNKLLNQLGQQTARMKREDEIESFKQKEQVKADIEKADVESLAKTGLTAEQALQASTITEDFEVKEDSIAGQAIRKLIKKGKTPDQIRKILGLAEDATGKISDEQFTRQEKLRKEFEASASAKNYMVAVQQFAGIEETLESGTGPGDMASIFQFMKILDPTSVVREAEFDAAARSIGIKESLSNYFNPDGKVEGAILTEEGRDQFKAIAQKLFDNRKETFDARATKFITLAKEAGTNPRSVVLDFENIPGFASNLSEKSFAPIDNNSSDDETVRFLKNTGNTLTKDSEDTDVGGFIDFNTGETTSGTNVGISEIGTGFVTQKFGATSPLSIDNVKLANGGTGTPGIDIDGKIGDPISSPISGIVKDVIRSSTGLGNSVIIVDDQGNEHYFNHLSQRSVNKGAKITKGQVFASMGNSGSVIKGPGGDGSHLDYRVKSSKGWIDPNEFLIS